MQKMNYRDRRSDRGPLRKNPAGIFAARYRLYEQSYTFLIGGGILADCLSKWRSSAPPDSLCADGANLQHKSSADAFTPWFKGVTALEGDGDDAEKKGGGPRMP